MPCEMLPVMRGSHQLFGMLRDSGLCFGELTSELRRLLRIGWQPGQAKGQASIKFQGRSSGSGSEVRFLEFPVHKPINRVFSSGYFFHLEWPVSPEFLGFVAALLPIFGKSLRGGDLFTLSILFLYLGHASVAWPRSSLVDPVANPPSLFLGQLVRLFRRHLHVLLNSSRKNIEKAFFPFAGNQDFILVGFPSTDHRFSGSHIEVALDLLRIVPVTSHALLGKQRLHLEGKELLSIRDLPEQR